MGNSAFKTLGGVSPLKKGEKGAGSGKTTVRKVRAGTVGTKARTNKAQLKSGYSTPGADYINVHAFGPNTRLTSSLADTLGPSLSSAVRGKGSSGITPQVIKDELGNIVYDPYDITVSTTVEPGEESDQKKRETEFAANCYDKDGKIRKGHKFMSQFGYEIACGLDPDYIPAKNGKGKGKVVTRGVDKEGNVIFEYKGEGEHTTETKEIKEGT